jgi:hypothetical protein
VSAHRVSHLRVLDGDGNVTEFASVEEENEGLRSALSRAEKVIRNLRAELQDNRAKARKKFPIDLVFTDWQDAMVGAGFKGKAQCKLSNDRIDSMASIFEAGYTLADFKLAIVGMGANPYVIYGKRRANGTRDDVDVDLTTVCKEAKRFEEACRLGFVIEHARNANQA